MIEGARYQKLPPCEVISVNTISKIITWRRVEGAANYRVLRSRYKPSGSFYTVYNARSIVAQPESGDPSFTETGATLNWIYRIVALDDNGVEGHY